jgi:two-component system cell cycle response regulator DivK
MNNTILLIEDNEQNIYLIKYLLEQNGFAVVEARTGHEGIDKASSVNPALILLDIQLPDIIGYDVVRELRKLSGLEKLPIIAVTSYAMSGDRAKCIDAGCSGYLEKPINPDLFVGEIRKYLSKELNP